MSNVTLKMKMSPTTAGKFFQKACRLEDENACLKAEVERLRGRCEELEADQKYAKGALLCPKWAKSQVLIKQAEAVEHQVKIERDHFDSYAPCLSRMEQRAQRLRQQAAAPDMGGEK